MRLIDADTLEGYMHIDPDGVHYITAEDLYATPTIDAAPVVRGEWEYILEQGIWMCTNCHKDPTTDLDADIWSAFRPPYCPNCGADMRSVEKGGDGA